MIDMALQLCAARGAAVRAAAGAGGGAYCRISNVFSKKPGFAGRKALHSL
jgi:hypothetical protein